MRALALLLLAAPALGALPTKRPSDIERGKELYNRHCVACHGESGAGDGPAATALVFPVPDLRGKVTATQATIDVVVRGRGAMPAYEASFDADDARRVLLFLAQNKPGAAPPPEPEVEEPPADDALGPEGGG